MGVGLQGPMRLRCAARSSGVSWTTSGCVYGESVIPLTPLRHQSCVKKSLESCAGKLVVRLLLSGKEMCVFELLFLVAGKGTYVAVNRYLSQDALLEPWVEQVRFREVADLRKFEKPFLGEVRDEAEGLVCAPKS